MNCQREYYHNDAPCEGVRSREALVEQLQKEVQDLTRRLRLVTVERDCAFHSNEPQRARLRELQAELDKEREKPARCRWCGKWCIQCAAGNEGGGGVTTTDYTFKYHTDTSKMKAGRSLFSISSIQGGGYSAHIELTGYGQYVTLTVFAHRIGWNDYEHCMAITAEGSCNSHLFDVFRCPVVTCDALRKSLTNRCENIDGEKAPYVRWLCLQLINLTQEQWVNR